MEKPIITVEDSGDERDVKLEKNQKQFSIAEPLGKSLLRNVAQDQYNRNAIKPEFPSLYDPIVGNMNHQEEMRQMEAMGLPTNFQLQGPDYPFSREFFCNTCHVQMTTEQAMEAHLVGAQHLKTQLNKELYDKGKVKLGGPSDYIKFEDHERKHEPKKKPKRLSEKLLEVHKPYAGLKFIQEILSVTKADKDPHYYCKLCNFDGGTEAMLNHLLCRDHQENFLKNLAQIDVNLVNLEEEIEKVKENGKTELLATIYSDELMPWPEGLAPWSVEQGGIGIPPTSQLNKIKKQKQPDFQAPTKKVELHMENLPSINSTRSLSAHYDAVAHLLDEVIKFHTDHAKHPEDVDTLKNFHALAQANLAQLSGLRLNRL